MVGLGFDLATLIESRIGARRSPPPIGWDGGRWSSCGGIGGKVARSSMPNGEWLRKDKAVNHK